MPLSARDTVTTSWGTENFRVKRTVLAALLVGLCFVGTTVQAKDWQNAPFEEIKPAAEHGNVRAQFYLGVRYDRGFGVTQDYSQAAFWYRKAAEQGAAEAQYNLGSMYENGLGMAQDYRQAVVWYRKAAEQGHSSAQFLLAKLYASGQGVAQDYRQAAIWSRKAAEQGDFDAQHVLGVMHDNGLGVAQDYKMAYVWFSVAAANGNGASPAERDKVAEKLTPEVLANAQTLAGQYFEKYQQKK